MSSPKPAAAAAAGSGALVAVGGKRKGADEKDAPDDRQHAKRRAGGRTNDGGDSEEDSDDHLDGRPYEDDSHPDSAEDLKDQLRKLAHRPVMAHFVEQRRREGGDVRVTTAAVVLFCTEFVIDGDYHQNGNFGLLVDELCEFGPDQKDRAGHNRYVLELSLLLRLLVALGGDLNTPMAAFYVTQPGQDTAELSIYPVAWDLGALAAGVDTTRHSETTTAIAAHLHRSHVAAAVLMAGRRLNVDWCVYAVPVTTYAQVRGKFSHFTTAAKTTAHAARSLGGLKAIARLVHVAGERGIYFTDLHFPAFFDMFMAYRNDALALVAHLDDSLYDVPCCPMMTFGTTMGILRNIDARRHAFRVAFNAGIEALLNNHPDLLVVLFGAQHVVPVWNLVVSYAKYS